LFIPILIIPHSHPSLHNSIQLSSPFLRTLPKSNVRLRSHSLSYFISFCHTFPPRKSIMNHGKRQHSINTMCLYHRRVHWEYSGLKRSCVYYQIHCRYGD
jgi:hypothetical protein